LHGCRKFSGRARASTKPAKRGDLLTLPVKGTAADQSDAIKQMSDAVLLRFGDGALFLEN